MGRLDDVIDSSIAALVGIILVAAVLIPIGVNVINAIGDDGKEFVPLLMVVITITIVGLIIGIIRFYQNSKRRICIKEV